MPTVYSFRFPMIRRSDLSVRQLHVLQSSLFGNRRVAGVIFSYQLITIVSLVSSWGFFDLRLITSKTFVSFAGRFI